MHQSIILLQYNALKLCNLYLLFHTAKLHTYKHACGLPQHFELKLHDTAEKEVMYSTENIYQIKVKD